MRQKELYVKNNPRRQQKLEELGFYWRAGNASLGWLKVCHAAAIYSRLHRASDLCVPYCSALFCVVLCCSALFHIILCIFTKDCIEYQIYVFCIVLHYSALFFASKQQKPVHFHKGKNENLLSHSCFLISKDCIDHQIYVFCIVLCYSALFCIVLCV